MIPAIVHRKLQSGVFKIKRISAFGLNFNSFNVYCVKWMENKLISEKSPILVNYHLSSYIIIQQKDLYEIMKPVYMYKEVAVCHVTNVY